MRQLQRPSEPLELARARKKYPHPDDKCWEEWTKKPTTDKLTVRDVLYQAQEGYCAYCEERIDKGGHIEHHRPKSKHRKLTFDWDNLLLSCTASDSCGMKKGNIDDPDLLHPYQDPAQDWLWFEENGEVNPRDTLPKRLYQRVQKSLSLLNIDKCPRLVRKRNGILKTLIKQLQLISNGEELQDFKERILGDHSTPFITARMQILDRL